MFFHRRGLDNITNTRATLKYFAITLIRRRHETARHLPISLFLPFSRDINLFLGEFHGKRIIRTDYRTLPNEKNDTHGPQTNLFNIK